MERTITSRRRRLAGLALVGSVAAGLLAVGAPAASAAPEQQITGASFTWALHDYVQYTDTGAGCHWFSAGPLTAATAAGWAAQAGDVEILQGSGTAQPTSFTDKCAGGTNYLQAGVTPPAVNPTSQSINQRVRWTNGGGTRNPNTGEVDIDFEGVWSIKYSGPNAVRVVDPHLSIEADGSGTLTATVRATAAAGAADIPGVVLAEFDGVDLDDSTFAVTPTFAGREVTIVDGGPSFPSTATKAVHNPSGGTPVWGAWPQSWVRATNAAAAASRFYSSSAAFPLTGLDALKAPAPISFDLGTVGPAQDQQAISVVVPDLGDGEFVWTIDDDDTVQLGTATEQGDHFLATGSINPIDVSDTRIGGGGWSISGQIGNFGALDGKYLGWTPEVVSASSGYTVTPGATRASGFDAGNGLKDAAPLASTAAGSRGSATLGADLTLKAPITTDPGTYTGTLTITALG